MASVYRADSTLHVRADFTPCCTAVDTEPWASRGNFRSLQKIFLGEKKLREVIWTSIILQLTMNSHALATNYHTVPTIPFLNSKRNYFVCSSLPIKVIIWHIFFFQIIIRGNKYFSMHNFLVNNLQPCLRRFGLVFSLYTFRVLKFNQLKFNFACWVQHNGPYLTYPAFIA